LEEILDWLKLAEKFAEDGDAESMVGAANQILELDKNCADGYALIAESALYFCDLEYSEKLLAETFSRDKNNLRGRLVRGGIAFERFQLIKAFQLLDNVIKFAEKHSDDFLARKTLIKALCWTADGLYLAGEPEAAAENLREASRLTENINHAAELFSKHLFLKNYNSPAEKSLAQEYNKFFANITPYSHENYNHKKIKIGYISPDFRFHTVANFVQPLLKNFDDKKFSVTCYFTGEPDFVTQKLKNKKIAWRDLNGMDAATATKIIRNDEIDILVDLSGHSQNNCLPILAYKPAPVQITAIGYTATTGLNCVDYFLTDKICADDNFTEKILPLDGCQFCFSPVKEFPAVNHIKNNCVTFGSFNNFAKVTDEVLGVWKKILDAVPNSKLVIKSKICSIEDGKKILMDRLSNLDFAAERIEMRPYSKDYLEQYNEIDIALDSFPYNGGLTTCEALYMGVPVISLRGDYHGAKIGASILTAAGLPELIAQDSDDYIKKAVELADGKFADYHKNLREKISKSALMNGEKYAAEIEKLFELIQ
jgi:predicted O-linked N-acetylglucosamine transferase (SPINDLY family)